MSEDGQRGPGSGGTAHRGRPGAGQARQDAGGGSPPGGTPRPDALIPALDEGQLAALREIGREWDRVSADRQVWRQALPADPSLGEYPGASEVRPGLFTRFARRGTRRAAAADPDHERFRDTAHAAGPGRPGTEAAGLRPTAGASAIAVERMRKLVALPVLSADALSSVAYGPQAMLAVLVLAGLPGLSYSLPVGAAIVVLMLAVGVSYRQTIRAYPQGGGSYRSKSSSRRTAP